MTLFTQNCKNRLHKKMFSPDDHDDDKTNIQNINTTSNDSLYDIISYLNLDEKNKIKSVNKRFLNSVPISVKRYGFEYDGYKHKNLQDFEKFIQSDIYDYCTSLIIPPRFNKRFKLPKKLLHLDTGGYTYDEMKDYFGPYYKRRDYDELDAYTDFNESLELPNTLKSFKMGGYFNQHVELPISLEKLIMGDMFNRNIKLHFNLKHLGMINANNFNQQITLPNNLEYFTMGNIFNNPITLPDNIKKFRMGESFNSEIKLSNSLEIFLMGKNFNKQITLPSGIKNLKMGQSFNSKIKLSNNLEKLVMGYYFDKPIDLPKTLVSLKMGHSFNQSIILPDILFLSVGNDFSHSLVYPNSLIIFQIHKNNTNKWKIPENLQSFKNQGDYSVFENTLLNYDDTLINNILMYNDDTSINEEDYEEYEESLNENN